MISKRVTGSLSLNLYKSPDVNNPGPEKWIKMTEPRVAGIMGRKARDQRLYHANLIKIV